MKKNSLFIFIFWITGALCHAQTLTEVFPKMPDKLLLYVDSVKRLDLMDLYKANKNAQIKNNFNETSQLTFFSENYLTLQTGTSTLELILLPMINDSKLLCVINTSCAPVCDSNLKFFTTDWKELDRSVFITPANPHWFFKEAKESGLTQSASLALESPSFMKFHFDKEKTALVQSYETPQYLSADDRKKLDPALKEEPKVFHWKQTRFE